MSIKIVCLISLVFCLTNIAYTQEICNNGIDDDNDGIIDLNDSLDCACNSGSFPGTINSMFSNPSFEDTVCCPSDFSQVNCAETWLQASDATSDFYHECDFFLPTENFLTPPQLPIPDGAGYAGFVCGLNAGEPYMEYLGTCLNTPLTAGVSYSLQYYTALGFNQTSQNIAIYGTPDCGDLPWAGNACPIGVGGWIELTNQTIYYSPNGAWQLVTLTFIPTIDINAIAIGGSCGVSENSSTSYYYVDGLTLQTTESFLPIINVDQVSCSEEVDLIAQQYDPSISIQWYLDGVALVNETDDTLSTLNYGSGLYTLEFDDGSNICKQSNVLIDLDQYSLPNIGAISIETGCIDSSQNSISLQNVYGNDSIYYVDLIQSPGDYNDMQTVVQNDTLLFDGLAAGPYQIQVSNSIGCAIDTIVEIIEADNPGSAELIYPLCYGDATGVITATSSITSAVEYTILDESGNVLNLNGGSTAEGLVSGMYTVITLDVDAQCATSISVEILEPNAIKPSLDLIQPLCHDGKIGAASIDTVLNVQGSYQDLNYIWYTNDVDDGVSYDSYTDSLLVGEYKLKVTDGFGCEQDVTFSIKPPNPIIGVLNVVSPTYCRSAGYQQGNGEVTASTLGPDASGSGNITYHWRNLENGDESNTSTFVVNVPGFMEATLTDVNGCVFIDTIRVDSVNPKAIFTPISDQFEGPYEYEGTEPMQVEFINESVNFSKETYSLSDTTFSWNLCMNTMGGTEENDWFFSFDFDEKIEKTYEGEAHFSVCLVAKNFNNCRDTTCKDLIVHKKPMLEVSNVFTPGTQPNATFFFPSAGIDDFNCVIYNRYGIEIYRFKTIEDQWGGNHYQTGEPCVDGTYFFTYIGRSTDRTTFSGQGNVQLIRH